jgi:hypothetical protein
MLVVLVMTRAFRQYPICRCPFDQSGLGSSHATTWARATLQLGIYELQYVLQYMVINEIFANKQLILVFLFLFSVALAQNTTGITTATTMAAAGGNGPLAPHMRPCAPRRCFELLDDNPPSKQMYFLGGLRVCMALKALLCSGNDESPQHQSVLRAIHTLNSPKNYNCVLGGLSPIHSTHWRRAQGLMWGTRGTFCRRRLWLAMAVLVDVGHWRLTSDQPTGGIVKIVYGSIFLFLRRSHTFLTSDLAAK